MIVVIADDFTGAAELGGIGLRYKLAVEINTVINTSSKADLLIVATDTRSVDKEEAIKRMEMVTRQVKQLNPSILYKKTDSVLRGHVIPEITVQLKALGLEKALLVPANPALGRTIQDGRYYLYGKPVHETSFSADPEFPVTSAGIPDMLRIDNGLVYIKKPGEQLPASGITVGEVRSGEDLKIWAASVDNNTLAAGGAGFFSAILDRLKISGSPVTKALPGKDLSSPRLFICGSTFNKSVEAIQKIKDHDGPVSYIPDAIVSSNGHSAKLYSDWVKETVSYIQTHGRAIVAVNPVTDTIAVNAVDLREKMAQLVSQVLQEVNINELFIEGGSTTAAVLRKLGLHTFVPVKEMASGVIRMSAPEKPGLFITVKPGSYNWPVEIWVFKERI